jgi:hypothetical protein
MVAKAPAIWAMVLATWAADIVSPPMRPTANHLDVVLIHLGSRPPGYMHVAARQAREISGRDTVVIGPKLGASYRGAKLDAFRDGEQLSGFGLSGFWRYTAERFFVLEEHMRATGMSSCIHLESDNLLYVSPAEFGDWLFRTYGDGVAVCPFTRTEDTAAVFYVGSLDALAAVNEALLEMARMPPGELLEKHGGEMANEMRMLRLIREAGLCSALPASIEDAERAGSAHVFDPGSYGQYIDGWYWEPGVSFTDARHLVGEALAEGRYRLYWNAWRTAPLVSLPTAEPKPLVNLHVHSKRLDEWTPRTLTPPKRPAGFPSEAPLPVRVRKAANDALATATKIRRRNRRAPRAARGRDHGAQPR